jgi:CheY-like chemotaxis protein
MDAGATEHLSKPVNPEVLLKTVIRWLEANQPTSSPLEQTVR